MAKPTNVFEERVKVPTYCVGPPSKNPCILQEGHSNIYPYTLRDNLYQGREIRAYRGLSMENTYLKITVFPELGGHIYSVHDKVAEKEMFYTNDVFKPGLILLRGAWCPFGVEFNFPCGHTVTTLSEVDSFMRENDDGSGSIFVSDLEHVSRMKWLVEIRLHPAERNFRTVIRLMNGTEIARRYYFWSNAAVEATKQLQFISPAKEAKPSWSKGTKPFPIMQGVDKSWYKNHDHSVDLFTVNSTEDYFGYYDHGRDFGVVHVAPWYKVQGKKFFTWGTGPDGLIWADILSEDAGPYIEIQSGPFPTQGDFGMLQPHTGNFWEAMWFPVHDTGGFDFANEYGALSLDISSETKKLSHVGFKLNVNRNVYKARIRIRAQKRDGSFRTVYSEPHNLSVHTTLEDSFNAELKNSRLEFKLIDSSGVHLMTYIHEQEKKEGRKEEEEDSIEPGGIYGPSLETVFQKGYRFEKYNNLTKALEKYKEAVREDPFFTKPLVEMAKIQIYMGKLEEAEKNLKRALKRGDGNSDARYYYGVVLKRRGKYEQAVHEFQKLSLDNRTAALGFYKLGQIEMIQGNYIDACNLFKDAFKYNPDDIYTELMVAVSMRKKGRKRGPMKVIKRILEKDPTNFTANYEKYLLAGITKGLNARPEGIRLNNILRDDPQSYLDLAVRYGNINLIQDAVDVLERYGNVVGEPNAFVSYYLGYYLRKAGKKREGNKHFREASGIRTDYGFPFRSEGYRVFNKAIEIYPKDSSARHYLGNLLASRRRVDEAFGQWKECERLNSKNPTVYRNLGLVLFKARDRAEDAVTYYRKALDIDPDDRDFYWELDQVYSKLGRDHARVRLHKSRPEHLQKDMKTDLRLADAYFNLEKFDKAIEVLENNEFYPWEGGKFVRQLYVSIYLYKAEQFIEKQDYDSAREMVEKAGMYPENIKIRPSKKPKFSNILYYKGIIFKNRGQGKEARDCWRQAADEKYSRWSILYSSYAVYKGRCLKALGWNRKAEKMFGVIEDTIKGHENRDPARYFYLKGVCELETGRFEDARDSLKKSITHLGSNLRARRALKQAEEQLKST